MALCSDDYMPSLLGAGAITIVDLGVDGNKKNPTSNLTKLADGSVLSLKKSCTCLLKPAGFIINSYDPQLQLMIHLTEVDRPSFLN